VRIELIHLLPEVGERLRDRALFAFERLQIDRLGREQVDGVRQIALFVASDLVDLDGRHGAGHRRLDVVDDRERLRLDVGVDDGRRGGFQRDGVVGHDDSGSFLESE